jgi:hypothetical protein
MPSLGDLVVLRADALFEGFGLVHVMPPLARPIERSEMVR